MADFESQNKKQVTKVKKLTISEEELIMVQNRLTHQSPKLTKTFVKVTNDYENQKNNFLN